MKTKFITSALLLIVFSVGCTDHEAEARRAREDAEAKARADAARKEMDAVPKAFKSPPFFKLNEPEKKPDSAGVPKKPNP